MYSPHLASTPRGKASLRADRLRVTLVTATGADIAGSLAAALHDFVPLGFFADVHAAPGTARDESLGVLGHMPKDECCVSRTCVGGVRTAGLYGPEERVALSPRAPAIEPEEEFVPIRLGAHQ